MSDTNRYIHCNKCLKNNAPISLHLKTGTFTDSVAWPTPSSINDIIRQSMELVLRWVIAGLTHHERHNASQVLLLTNVAPEWETDVCKPCRFPILVVIMVIIYTQQDHISRWLW